MITGCGKPAALQGNEIFCFSLTVTEGGGFVMKCGNSEKEILLVTSAVQKFKMH